MISIRFTTVKFEGVVSVKENVLLWAHKEVKTKGKPIIVSFSPKIEEKTLY